MIICSGCFSAAPAAAKTIAGASEELIEEEEPVGLTRLGRRRRNKVEPSTERQQDAQRESVERGVGEGAQTHNESGNSRPSEPRVSSNKVLKKDAYYLHQFRHTRTSANKEVRCLSDHTSF